MRLTCRKCLMLRAVVNLLIVFPTCSTGLCRLVNKRTKGQGVLFAAGVGEAFLKGDGSIKVIGNGAW
ncbi:MAG: hypothetical protein QXT81_03295 [Candidatus Bathyarchaeia archaeon]